MTQEGPTGFDKPMQPDDYTAKLYTEFGLGETPSLAQVEKKATELSEDPLTMLSGASLVMGREVMAKDDNICNILAGFKSGADRFGALMVRKTIE